MGTIYEIVGDVKALSALVESLTDEETGEVRELTDEDRATIMGWIEDQTDAFDEKFDRICKVYRNIRGQADVATAERDALKSEMDRLSKRAKARENEAERVKSLLWYAMDALKKKKHKTPLFSATIQNTAASLKIGDSTHTPVSVSQHLPARFLKEPEVDGSLIREELKSGRWTTNEVGAVLDAAGVVIPGLFFIPGQTMVIR